MAIPLERWQVQQGAIQSMITLAIANSGPLGVQLNQDGTSGIQSVELAIPEAPNIFPFIGIEFANFDEKPYGSRCHLVSAHFNVLVAIRRDYDPSVTDTAAQALADLTNYINDGNGNGLSPVLRADPTLLGTANYGYIAGMVRDVLRGQGDAAGVIASAMYHYVAEDQVKF